MARYGENALKVIEGVKQRIEELSPACRRGSRSCGIRPLGADRARDRHAKRHAPAGVDHRCAVCDAVSDAPAQLGRRRSLLLPLGVLFSFVCMRMLGINSNIMSLGGIAIAIGEMIDAGVVMVENAHKRLERRGGSDADEPMRRAIIIDACKEVGPPLFFSLLIIAVVVPAGVHAGGAGRPAVRTAGLHQDVRDGGRPLCCQSPCCRC